MAVVLPPGLVAVTVYVLDAEIAVGVPETVPSVCEKVRPAGSVGEIDHEETVPPLDVGVTAVIATSFVKVNELVL